MAADDSADLPPVSSDLLELERIHPSALDNEGQMQVFKQWFREDSRHSSQWRTSARNDFDFIAGDQWSVEDQQTLKNQMRPAIVFNRALTIIKAVAGMEINSRHEINFIPRNTQDAAVSELLTGASKWMADECDGEDEESIAFQHANICGMGWLEHRLAYDDDPQGKYVEEAIDPLEMYWDARSKKRNLMDSRRRWRVRRIPIGDAMELFPGCSRAELDASWALNEAPDEPLKTLEERRVRDENISSQWASRDEVVIICLQWYEKEPYWKVADPATNATAELTEDQFQKLSERMKQLGIGQMPAVQMHRKVFRQAFIGNRVLKIMPAPLPDRFSWTPITGEIHHTKGLFYGLVRVMRDPQMWSNKWLSQSLHILNSTAKGGILAETDAFEDQSQAEASYAQPQAITWVKKGSISGQQGSKIMPKPGAAFPQGHMQLMELAITALRDVTGINYELLGLKDENQPGILEAQRKQAGMTVLATMFDSLRRCRKEIGHIRLYYIQNFLSDGRLVRVVGQDGAKAIPLVRDKCLGHYDVIVDDAPTSPNQKEANWAIILSIMPAFKDQLLARPDLMTIVLEYSPLPQRLVDALKQAMAQPDPNAQKQQQLQEQRVVAQISKDQSTAEMQNAKAGATQATAMYDLAMAQNLLTKHQHDMARAALDAQSKEQDVKARQDSNDNERARILMDAGHTAEKMATERAKQANLHADTLAKHVGSAHQAMQPIPHSDDYHGGPMQPRPPRQPL